MNPRFLRRLPDWLCYMLGFLFGYAVFAAFYRWLQGAELWMSLAIGLPLHAPIAAVYGGILVLTHRRWNTYVSRAALFSCGIAAGLFPFLSVFPLYNFRLEIAVFLLSIQVATLITIVIVSYFIGRWMKRPATV